MSSLNKEAIKSLLAEEDILSSSGRINSIWELYTKNINFQNPDNDILRMILSSLRKNVIDHLQLSDDTLEDCITRFSGMVDEVCGDMQPNELTIFLSVLAHAISDYSSKEGSVDNMEINIDECDNEMPHLEQLRIVSAMERYGFLDSKELQSLLDDRSLAITTASTDICRRWGKGSPSEEEGRDAHQPLQLEDFIPNVSEVFLKAREMFVWNSMVVDNFPTQEDFMRKLICPKDMTDDERFYQRDTYLINSLNYQVLDSTAQFICSLLDMDAPTAIFILNEANKRIIQTITQVGHSFSLLFSQLLVNVMLIRYLIAEGSETSPDTKIAVNGLKNKLAELVHALEDRKETLSFNESGAGLFSKTLPYINGYASFVTPDADEIVGVDDNEGFSVDASLAATEAMLTDLVGDTSSGVVSNSASAVAESSTVLGVLSPSIKSSVGQTPERNWDKIVGVVAECGSTLHKELNRALLEGNFENAANAIARELAFEQQTLTKECLRNGATAEALRTVSESIRMDVMTYSDLVNRVPGGIAKYEQSAKSYVDDMLKSSVTT